MAKNKLAKFADMKEIPFVLEYPFARLQAEGFDKRGQWGTEVFAADQPLTLELGCGKGEYTVGLADRNPDRNHVGIDIKGARMWSGATDAHRRGMGNVAFLRTSIELLDQFFAPGEVDEIWITFPDPQMQKVRKRLTGTRFMELYRKVLRPGGVIKLKTDSPFLYAYTKAMVEHNGLPLLEATDDLYAAEGFSGPLTEIRTHYERQWLERGLTIKYIAFQLPEDAVLTEPDVEIPHDTYRSYSRGYIECPQELTEKHLNDETRSLPQSHN